LIHARTSPTFQAVTRSDSFVGFGNLELATNRQNVAGLKGRGVGRALLEHRLADIDAPVYLEAATDRAASLYRRMGFLDLGRFSGRHMPAVGMWRPAP